MQLEKYQKRALALIQFSIYPFEERILTPSCQEYNNPLDIAYLTKDIHFNNKSSSSNTKKTKQRNEI